MIELIAVLLMFAVFIGAPILLIWWVWKWLTRDKDAVAAVAKAKPSKKSLGTSDDKYPKSPDQMITWLTNSGVRVDKETRKAIRNLYLEGKLVGYRKARSDFGIDYDQEPVRQVS